MQKKLSIVVTSIFYPNTSLSALAEGAKRNKWKFIIVGDVSSPKDFYLDGAEYFDIASQRNLGWKLADLCPERHYSRKNIGYLLAMANGSDVIVETDDDNIPYPEFWLPRQEVIKTISLTGSGWVNIYNFFSTAKIWPRGFPLEELHNSKSSISIKSILNEIPCPIQQGLANDNPDVDAVFRMTQELPVTFDKKGSYHIGERLWCPFNSQNTTWFRDVFPLLYLPSYCSFRMTDIWRSFVAQRVIWEHNWGILFHDATVRQERNGHNLLKDFEQEVPGYINNNRIIRLLENVTLKNGVNEIGNNMLVCYEELVKHGIISDKRELDLLGAWLEDCQTIAVNGRPNS